MQILPRACFALSLFITATLCTPVLNDTLSLRPDPYTWTWNHVDFKIFHYAEPNASKLVVRSLLMETLVDLLYEVSSN